MEALSDQWRGAVWALARLQHGVVTYRQLISLGYSANAIRHRLASGRLHRVWRGVYAVGRPELSRRGQLMAAVLACGQRAVLSHASAAELWGLRSCSDGVIHVSVTGASRPRHLGIAAHRRTELADGDVTRLDGIPVTSPACTLIDIAPKLSPRALEAAINEADKRGLVDSDTLRSAAEAAGARRGAGAVRRVLDRRTFRLTDSELEQRFLPIARRAGLPTPETQQMVEGLRVDFLWRDLRLVVETDGLRYHRTAAQQAKDRARDQTLTAAGYTVLRFTHAQVRYERGRVEAVLASVAARLAT